MVANEIGASCSCDRKIEKIEERRMGRSWTHAESPGAPERQELELRSEGNVELGYS